MKSKLFLKGFTLISGTGEGPVENCGLLVDGDRIEKVGMLREFGSMEDAVTMDMTGKTIIPGMINTHTHVLFEPAGDTFALFKKESPFIIGIRGVNNLRKHLKAGFTYLRDLGGAGYIDVEIKKCLTEGTIKGPGLQVSGRMLTMTGGQGWQIGRECDGKDDARKAAREQLKMGVDLVKLMATGGVMTEGVEPGSSQLSWEEMEAAIEETHKAGKKTSAHAQGAEGTKNAILAGIDSIEHGIFLNDEIIELMIVKGVYLVPTLLAPHNIIKYGIKGGIPKYAVDKTYKVTEAHTNSFKKALKAGVKIAMGTDAGTPFNFHDKSAYELKLMVDCGMTPMQAILSATKSAANLLGIGEHYGTLENGKIADFIILKENPLENIETLMEVETVFKHGKMIE